ncbi:MAG TPA: T9SS type A sorting domain-containing protein, partial [Bacteroidia bacterium]
QIDDVSGLRITTSPNPTSEWLHVTIVGSNKSECIVAIHDMSGKILYSKKIIPASDSDEIFINLRSQQFAPGTYFVSVNNQQTSCKGKVIIN